MIKRKMLDAANSDKLAILESDEYPTKAGMLRADAQILRRTLSHLIKRLEERETITQPGVRYAIESAKVDLQMTEYLATFDGNLPGKQHDEERPVAGGVKNTRTGEFHIEDDYNDNVNLPSKY